MTTKKPDCRAFTSYRLHIAYIKRKNENNYNYNPKKPTDSSMCGALHESNINGLRIRAISTFQSSI